MVKKNIFFILISVLVIFFGIYRFFIREKKPEFTFFEVSRGNILQEISETGTVESGEEIKLSFKNSGVIEKINVKAGDLVKSNEILVKLDAIQLEIQLKEAQAALEVAQAQLDKLLAGATPEEIKKAQTTIENSQISLASAKENLSQAYEDALNAKSRP